MKRKYVARKKTLFLRYFVSNFITVSVLLVLVSLFVYRGLLFEYRSSVEKSKRSELTTFSTELSKKFDELESISYSLFSNPKTSPYSVNHRGYSGIQAIQEVKNYTAGNSLIWNLLYYTSYHEKESVTSTSSISTPSIFFEKKYQFSSENLKKLDEAFRKHTDAFPFFISAESIKVNEGTNSSYMNQIVAYVIPSKLNNRASAQCAVYLIREQTVQDLLQTVMADYDGYMYLFDSQNNLVTCTKGEGSAADCDEILSLYSSAQNANNRESELTMNGMVYSVIRQDAGHLSLLMVIPTQQYLQTVFQKQKLLLTLLFIALLLGILLSVFFSFSNYNPIRELTGKINLRMRINEGKAEARWTGNEISYISKTVDELFEKNAGLNLRVEELSSFRRRRLIGNLLYGGIWEADAVAQLQESGILTTKPLYAVFYLLIDDYQNFFTENSTKMQSILRSHILNKTEEKLQSIGQIYGAELSDNRMEAFLFGCDNNEQFRQLQDALPTLLRCFQDDFELSLSAGVSLPFENIAQADTAFYQAKTAAEYRFIRGKGSVIVYQECDMDYKGEYKYPIQLEKEILEAIRQAEFETIGSMIEQLMNEFCTEKATIQEIQYVCFGFVNSIFRLMSETRVKNDAEFLKLRSSFVNFHFETLAELRDRMTRLAVLSCRLVNEKLSGEMDRIRNHLREELFSYIDENYRDSELCLDSIARSFGFSPSYISRCFKEQTGDTLIRYLDNLRIKKAKQLLRETTLPLQELLVQVGYTDKTNFIRKFKKLENMTPIQYRTAYQARTINGIGIDGDA